VASGEELVVVAALPLVSLPVLMLLLLFMLKIPAVLLRYFVVAAADAVAVAAATVVAHAPALAIVVAATTAADAIGVVGATANAASVVSAAHAPAVVTLPPAYPSRHFSILTALEAAPPPPSPPRVAAPLPLRHPGFGDTCCSYYSQFSYDFSSDCAHLLSQTLTIAHHFLLRC
jgi:hypothetical protein